MKTPLTMSGFPGIALAGTCYGLFISILAIVPAAIAAWESFGRSSFDQEFILVLICAPITGAIVASIVGAACIGLICCFNYSMGFSWHPITASANAGGLTGYACTVGILNEFMIFDSWFALAFLLGPILATTAGAYGAMRFAIFATRDHYAKYGTEFDKSVPQPSSGQFRLRYLFVLTAWAAVMLGLVQAFGVLNVVLIAILGGYVILQICVHQLCKFMTSSLRKRVLPASDKIDIIFLPTTVAECRDFLVEADEDC